MFRGGAAAAADDIQQAGVGPFADIAGHVGGIQVILAKLVRQSCIGMGRDKRFANPGQLLDVLAQHVGPECAVEADGDRIGVAQAVVESLGGLAREGATRCICDGAGDHQRQFDVIFVKYLVTGEHSRLGVEGVKNRFDEQHIRAALDEAAHRVDIVIDQLLKSDIAVARIVDIRREGAGAAGGADDASHKAWSFGGRIGVGCFTRQACGGDIDLVGELLHLIVGHGDAAGVEAVGLDNIRTRLEIGCVNVADDLRLGQHQQVIVALDIHMPVGKALATIIRLLEFVALDHGAHGAIQDEDALLEMRLQQLGCVGHLGS